MWQCSAEMCFARAVLEPMPEQRHVSCFPLLVGHTGDARPLPVPSSH